MSCPYIEAFRNALVPVWIEIQMAEKENRKPCYFKMLRASMGAFKRQITTMKEWQKPTGVNTYV